eukprot:SAG11_NODE_29381_length_311_cov_1.061321_1_plen_94_part_10
MELEDHVARLVQSIFEGDKDEAWRTFGRATNIWRPSAIPDYATDQQRDTLLELFSKHDPVTWVDDTEPAPEQVYKGEPKPFWDTIMPWDELQVS